MTKSYVAFLRDLYDAIIDDCVVEFPWLTNQLERDRTRLHEIVEEMGQRFFTIDLPAFGKHLDRCLSDQRLSRSGIAYMGGRTNRSPIPRLFGGLVLRIFNKQGELRPRVDVHSVRRLRQLLLAAKKVRMECSDEATYTVTSEYFDIEAECRNPSLDWDCDGPEPTRVRPISFADGLLPAVSKGAPDLFWDSRPGNDLEQLRPALECVQHVADTVFGSMGLVNYQTLRPKHGPGAVADLKAGVSKYTFPHWPANLEKFFPYAEFATANLNTGFEHFQDISDYMDLLGRTTYRQGPEGTQPEGVSTHDVPCGLLAVPKTQKGPRLIAKEPTAHQWIQQAIKRDLEEKIRNSALRHCINFVDQGRSQEAALKASETGMQATIDLSSASDRLSLWTVERAFRVHQDLLQAFFACRTRYLSNKLDKKLPKLVKLRKFAPAGSALTFPVQTMVYSVICIGVLLYKRRWACDKVAIETAARLIRVFGDDLIVPVDIFGELIQVLTYLGLKVNSTKSYAKGNFRESCGMDAYMGEEVTPAYVLEPYRASRPESVASIVACSNNFFRKGLWRTAAWLQSTVPQKIAKAIPVVSADSGAFGWASTCGYLFNQRNRWNGKTHTWEVNTIGLRTKTRRTPIESWQSLLQYYTEAPTPESMIQWSSGVDSRPSVSLCRRWVPVAAPVRKDRCRDMAEYAYH
jgi:hypothetical protein